MADEEPTPEELRAICKKFMLNAPPGEFMEVVTDIRGLVSDETIINDVVPEAFREYNTEQMLVVDHGDHKIVICKEAQVGDNEYLDAVTQESVNFDHITRKVTGSNGGAGQFGGAFEEYRAAAQTEGQAYVADHYATGTLAAFNADNGVTIAISAAKFEPRNFWTGAWRSVWTASFAPGKNAEITLSGNVSISVHFYEDGNVQLNASNTLEAKCKGGATAEATAQAIFKAIGVAETKYQQALEGAYAMMDTSTFKALRRQLPVTASKVDWDKIGTNVKIEKK